jgi:DNA-binding response OmpR family regulator
MAVHRRPGRLSSGFCGTTNAVGRGMQTRQMQSVSRERLLLARQSVATHPGARRILLAEDDSSLRFLLAQALRGDGYLVVAAANGLELMDVLSDSLSPDSPVARFDLVLSDIRMPGWPGLGALTRVRGHPAMPPFILFTAFGDDETHRHALELGALTLLDKPFDIDELRELVADILRD